MDKNLTVINNIKSKGFKNMKLANILVGIEGLKLRGELDTEITGIESNSLKIKEGNLFIAIKGFSTDGHEYVEKAIENGAIAVMLDTKFDIKSLNIPKETIVILAEDTRKASGIIACNFYGNPTKKMKLIGVTGTKGKTTTTFMIKEILEKAGKKVGLVGTIATYINGKKYKESDRTTPDALELQYLFSEMLKSGVEYAVMEVSSQSLKLNRVIGCEFDLAVFTNFSKDHISANEHPDMEDYFNSKLELFKMCKNAIVNIDDLQVSKMPKLFPESNIVTYGIDNHANMLARDITVTNMFVDFRAKINGKNERIKVGIPGRFSVYNSLAAIGVAEKFGVDTEAIKQALLEVRVPGRSELVDNNLEIPVMIDYAHSPESLQNILSAVKSYTRGMVISVFGCGGDRDSSKRPIMGEISGKIADYTIITSDNPRTEVPEEIVNQIEVGIKKTKGKYEVIVDRKEAMEKAIKMATKRDIVVLAGKGHETYQEINHVKHDFNERVIVKEIFKKIEDENK